MNHLYFAYGSNLDRDQMQDRCPESETLRIAHLHGYRLAFGGHSPNWEGAPATVVPEEDFSVPGLLYRITIDELEVLDTYEGHPVRYERQIEPVVDEHGTRHEAQVYIKELDEGDFERPPGEYLDVLKEAYEELGFETTRLERAARLGDDSE
jgi:cation transport regulator ChaC